MCLYKDHFVIIFIELCYRIGMKFCILIIRCIHTRSCLIVILVICVLFLGRLFQHRRPFKPYKDRGDLMFFHRNSFNGTEYIPGLFMKKYEPVGESYCRFKFGFPETFSVVNSDVGVPPELGSESSYRVIYNAVYGRNYINFSEESTRSVTYCTHVTPEFVYYITEIVNRWDGLVSVSAFTPSTDASIILCVMKRLCSCLPGMERVSLHFIFPAEYPPDHVGCPPDPFSCAVPDAKERRNLAETFRNHEGLVYPVNVARNVARVSSRTSFVLVSDVELFPSEGLVPRFLKMLGQLKTKSGADFNKLLKRFVYVLPVFEVDGELNDVPRKKSQLLSLIKENRAVYFHRWVCLHCQRFPGLQRWLHRRLPLLDHTVQPLLVVRREFPYHRWEPVYIGTNQEPLYSELLSWEGQQDKMTQMHEMCLLSYRFVIVDGAFLVHAPGMKRRTTSSSGTGGSWQVNHRFQNMAHYDTVIDRMTKRHGAKLSCRVH